MEVATLLLERLAVSITACRAIRTALRAIGKIAVVPPAGIVTEGGAVMVELLTVIEGFTSLIAGDVNVTVQVVGLIDRMLSPEQLIELNWPGMLKLT
jgi:hypothetical protein